MNSAGEIYVESNGQITRVDAAFADEAHLRRTIDKIVGRIGGGSTRPAPWWTRASPTAAG